MCSISMTKEGLHEEGEKMMNYQKRDDVSHK
jgi:hypothetical protein